MTSASGSTSGTRTPTRSYGRRPPTASSRHSSPTANDSYAHSSARSSRLRAAGRLERLDAQRTLHRLDPLHRRSSRRPRRGEPRAPNPPRAAAPPRRSIVGVRARGVRAGRRGEGGGPPGGVMPVVSATPHAPPRGDAKVAGHRPGRTVRAILRRSGSPMKDAGNVMCIAMAAAAVARWRVTRRSVHRARTGGRAWHRTARTLDDGTGAPGEAPRWPWLGRYTWWRTPTGGQFWHPGRDFPGHARGPARALDAARYRSAAGTPKVLVIAEGKDRQVIRRFENGHETWLDPGSSSALGRATGCRTEAGNRVPERRGTVPTSRHRG